MRAFWILIGILVLSAAAFALMGQPSREEPKTAPTTDAQPDSPDAMVAKVAPDASTIKSAEPVATAPTGTPEASPAPVSVAATPTPEIDESLDSLRKQRAEVLLRVQTLREQAGQLELSVERLPDRAASLEEKLSGVREQIRTLESQADALAAKIGAAAVGSLANAEPVAPPDVTPPQDPSPVEPPQDQAKADAADAPAEPSAPGNLTDFNAPTRIAGYEVLPAKLDVRPQGGVLVDERFVVTGSGTQPDPFVVPWELLTSAEDAFAPKSGKKQIPYRIAMLDGKYVRVKGYVAFPLAMDQPRELLAMLNQWDGCCIGVPPTPYDAIEVQLRAPANGDDRFAISGEIAGRFGVKPYLVGDWLVGLYVMENADFKARGAPGS